MYDVCLSFAGEDRVYVEEVYRVLDKTGLRVFYDKANQIQLWSNDLTIVLENVYRKESRYCIIFISKHYVRKKWTKHERTHAMDRHLTEEYSYILPARFDDTPLPGLSPSIAYIDCRQLDPRQFAELVVQKISGPVGLSADEILLLFSRRKYEEAKAKLTQCLNHSGQDVLNPSQKSFVLYNLACANSRMAQLEATTKRSRNKLLDAATDALLKWFEHVRKSTVRTMPDAIQYVQADDDLLCLRKEREQKLKHIIGIVSKEPTGFDGGCVTFDTHISTPTGPRIARDFLRGQEFWSISVSIENRHRRVRAYVQDIEFGKHTTIIRVNRSLQCTAAQRLYVIGSGWTKAMDISVGMKVLAEKGTHVIVDTLEACLGECSVIAFVSDHPTSNFFADGLLCHNAKE